MTEVDRLSKLLAQAIKSAIDEAQSDRELQTPSKKPSGWLNKSQSASYLGVSRPTFLKWTEEYQIPYTVIDGLRRYSSNDLDEFMQEHSVKKVRGRYGSKENVFSSNY